jgi:hypothetical protein
VATRLAKRCVRVRVVENVEGARLARFQLKRIGFAAPDHGNGERGVLLAPQQRYLHAAAFPMGELDHRSRRRRILVRRATP